MKALNLIPLTCGLLMIVGPSQAAMSDAVTLPAVYSEGSPAGSEQADLERFIEKSAELYRGQLMTRSEMREFLQQIHSLSGTNLSPVQFHALVAQLAQTPFNVDLASQVLQQVNAAVEKTRRDHNLQESERLEGIAQKLSQHVAKLKDVSSTFND